MIRPANFASAAPGRGLAVANATDGTPVAVINVMGSLFLTVAHDLFEAIEVHPKINDSRKDEPGIQEPLQKELLF